MKICANVIIPTNMKPLPMLHEIEAAWILARHFNTTVTFIQPSASYGIKSYDFTMNGIEWELKSPIGNSKAHTLKRQFDYAKGKNLHLIIDCRKTKLTDAFCESKIRFELTKHKSVFRLLMITKNEYVLAIK